MTRQRLLQICWNYGLATLLLAPRWVQLRNISVTFNISYPFVELLAGYGHSIFNAKAFNSLTLFLLTFFPTNIISYYSITKSRTPQILSWDYNSHTVKLQISLKRIGGKILDNDGASVSAMSSAISIRMALARSAGSFALCGKVMTWCRRSSRRLH